VIIYKKYIYIVDSNVNDLIWDYTNHIVIIYK